jgi:hypothetical protein
MRSRGSKHPGTHMDLLRRYIALRQEADRLQVELDEAKEALFVALKEMGGTQVCDGFRCTAATKPLYEYSPLVIAAEEGVKRLKEAERKNRTAVLISQTPYVRLTRIR